jgi:hypothetical protein
MGYTVGRAKRLFRKKWELDRFGSKGYGGIRAFPDMYLFEVHHYLLSLLVEKTGR